MIILVPEWANKYEEFWGAVQVRNLWFIKLRYLFVASLLFFLFAGEFLLRLNFTSNQLQAIIAVSVVIILYNSIILSLKDKVKQTRGEFNALHLSLVMMILDLIALMILVYFTGTIDSPLYVFFIFHMVIGSLILPGKVVYSISVITVFVFTLITMLEYSGIIASNKIPGLFFESSSHSFSYIILYLSIFATMMFICVFLANTIARTLYDRERQLWNSIEKLNEAEKTKQKYIMGIVHQIKSPITAFQALLDIILFNYLGPVSKEVEEKLRRMKTRGEEALNLINNVLRISKLKLLDVRTSEDLSINSMLQEIISNNSSKIQAKSLDVIFSDKRNKDRHVQGDKVMFELCFSNLLENSIKYVNAQGIIEVQIMDTTGEIIVSICDDGIGIPSTDLGKIYEQFFRGSNLKGSEYEGSGMGLSIVKEIIEIHGGKIKVQSPSRLSTHDKRGTEFIVSLPYLK